ncbi:MAG: MTH938/NDUFAF3 family protein [Desulfobacterales bacterium]|nr:MTH938/NDUFAF3 family protein [Desulfobacterales bacterium]
MFTFFADKESRKAENIFRNPAVAYGVYENYEDVMEFQSMNSIESYSFGHIVINGTSYTKDVIIYPDGRIESPWWRNQGHELALIDLQDLIATSPEIIICGIGAMGLMQPSAELKEYLEDHNIDFIAQKSSQAVETYKQSSGNKKVGACFHLTC